MHPVDGFNNALLTYNSRGIAERMCYFMGCQLNT